MEEQVNIQLTEVGPKASFFYAPVSSLSILFSHRFLIQNLLKRETKGRYNNSFLGYSWTVLEPALLSAVYYFLFIMLAENPDRLYPVWIIIGVIVWTCFGTVSYTHLTLPTKVTV